MSTEATLLARCESKCELCSSTSSLAPYAVAPQTLITVDYAAMLCNICHAQIDSPDTMDVNHWRCLNDSMWSQVQQVQVLAWRQLTHLSRKGETWANELLDMMYMEDETKKWAEIGMDEDEEKARDVNGVILQKGDDVTVIKDLPVKGSSTIIKQGTVVRGISLDADPRLISGKANGQSMYLIAEYCRKK
ncbi:MULTISPECIES: PhnA domain-containing protein [Vibrio]|uniref:Alkylphosphonate utilization protein n=1 Tax=Vibrio casei TaxID=673372 RepID=A0A368LHM2_9VIBR|nr:MULTISPECIES: PhnA domain-containing protein [Vibrio]RCS70125.1 alkylphosphonate utilization protein [Vibrio casei]SJN24142.1 Alkylphosphonate utilization operon protein PhnA [Vibrio casei]HBV77445.1 alkylphosphonate utilization protein [Vibrio sp.]